MGKSNRDTMSSLCYFKIKIWDVITTECLKTFIDHTNFFSYIKRYLE